MNTNVKTIGVLTSGGDAPGMNAALRGVVRAAESKGILVKGIEEGFEGLLHGKVRLMDRSSVRDIINHGGTILNSSRSKDFREIAGQETGAKACQIFGLDALVVIGGKWRFSKSGKVVWKIWSTQEVLEIWSRKERWQGCKCHHIRFEWGSWRRIT